MRFRRRSEKSNKLLYIVTALLIFYSIWNQIIVNGSTALNTTQLYNESEQNITDFDASPVSQSGKKVIPGGFPIGIYLKSDGVLVIGISTVTDAAGTVSEPAKDLVAGGDYITEVNGIQVNEKEELIQIVQESGGEKVNLTVRRKEEIFQTEIKPVQGLDGKYLLGVWVRDDAQGIGTLTYLDEEGNFGALGHSISDSDTSQMVEVTDGAVFEVNIKKIIKGESGLPGSYSGIICYSPETKFGTVSKNGVHGIFGTLDKEFCNSLESPYVEVAGRNEVRTGEAYIRCTIEGVSLDYRVEILAIDPGNDKSRSITLQVTDERLLEKTGGIVQGMSGSPILQNGKLIGAVTHVFVQDSTKGYGIFIDEMLGK